MPKPTNSTTRPAILSAPEPRFGCFRTPTTGFLLTANPIVTTLHHVPTSNANRSGSSPRRYRVWDLHPRVEHYRIALWDGLVELSSDLYDLTVCGPLTDGGAFGGGQRPYFRDIPCDSFKKFGVSMLAWRNIEQIVSTEKPDVVIVSANPRNISNWKMPNVVHSYGGAAVCWTKAHSYSSIPSFIADTIKRRFYQRYDRAICYGKLSFKELTALGFPADRARVAQNTIDTRRIFDDGDAIRKRGAELRDAAGFAGKKILLTIGRMDPEKRHQDLLDAWPRLKQLDPNLVMVMVSGGPMLEEIRSKAKALDAERILVTGRVPENDDYCWIAGSDITIFPGAVGLAINQALALGLPTIIADEFGADSEIVMHNETGWRYERGDIEALIATVREVLNNKTEVDRITNNAVKMMREDVTVENQYRSIDATIRDAIQLVKG